MNSKWRGIKTKSEKIGEYIPITITNRLGQKSIHLPRIDDKKRWAGYPGLAGTARKIAQMIPSPCITYVEPFAGTAKVYQEALKRKDGFRIQTAVLNDKSNFIRVWLYKEFLSSAFISNDDFVDCMKHWDEEFIELCKNMKGKFIITTRKENKTMLKSGFRNKLVKSEYVVSGKYPEVLITTNI